MNQCKHDGACACAGMTSHVSSTSHDLPMTSDMDVDATSDRSHAVVLELRQQSATHSPGDIHLLDELVHDPAKNLDGILIQLESRAPDIDQYLATCLNPTNVADIPSHQEVNVEAGSSTRSSSTIIDLSAPQENLDLVSADGSRPDSAPSPARQPPETSRDELTISHSATPSAAPTRRARGRARPLTALDMATNEPMSIHPGFHYIRTRDSPIVPPSQPLEIYVPPEPHRLLPEGASVREIGLLRVSDTDVAPPLPFADDSSSDSDDTYIEVVLVSPSHMDDPFTRSPTPWCPNLLGNTTPVNIEFEIPVEIFREGPVSPPPVALMPLRRATVTPPLSPSRSPINVVPSLPRSSTSSTSMSSAGHPEISTVARGPAVVVLRHWAHPVHLLRRPPCQPGATQVGLTGTVRYRCPAFVRAMIADDNSLLEALVDMPLDLRSPAPMHHLCAPNATW